MHPAVNGKVVGPTPTRPANYPTSTRESIIMNMTAEPTAVVEEVKYILSPLDRCDQCSAEALVLVKGVTGELLFCGHHYARTEAGLSKFAYEVIDERAKLIQNKLKDEDYV